MIDTTRPTTQLEITNNKKKNPDAIARPSQGSLGLIGLQSPLTIKTPKIKPASVPPTMNAKKTKKLKIAGFSRAKVFIFNLPKENY